MNSHRHALRHVVISMLLAAVTAAIMPACSLMKYLEDVPTPQIHFDKAKIQKLSWSQADMVLDFKLENPYPVGIQVQGWSWNLKVAGASFLDGKQTRQLTVQPRASGTVPMPLTLKFAQLLSAISAARGEEDVPFELGGKITLQTPVGPVSLPLRAKGTLPVLETPKVRFKTVTAKLEGLTTLLFNVGLGIQHGNGYKIQLATLGYNLKIAGYKVANGNTKPSKSVPNSTETVISLPIKVDLLQASSALVSTITSGKFAYDLGTDLGLDTPFGTAPLSFSDDGTVKIY